MTATKGKKVTATKYENLGNFSKAQTAGQRAKLQFAISQQLKSHFESRLFIHVEQKGSCPADRAATDNFTTHKSKMLLPGLCPRVENRHERSGLRVDGRKIGSLETIAERTGEHEIGGFIAATMLLGSHVLNMKGEERRRGLRKPTVFASLAWRRSDELACHGIHHEEVCLRKNSRAFACKIVTK